jgi:hypothetical protein
MEYFYLVSYSSVTGRFTKKLQASDYIDAEKKFEKMGYNTQDDYYVVSAKDHDKELLQFTRLQ